METTTKHWYDWIGALVVLAILGALIYGMFAGAGAEVDAERAAIQSESVGRYPDTGEAEHAHEVDEREKAFEAAVASAVDQALADRERYDRPAGPPSLLGKD